MRSPSISKAGLADIRGKGRAKEIREHHGGATALRPEGNQRLAMALIQGAGGGMNDPSCSHIEGPTASWGKASASPGRETPGLKILSGLERRKG
jgi:hypothetical protein